MRASSFSEFYLGICRYLFRVVGDLASLFAVYHKYRKFYRDEPWFNIIIIMRAYNVSGLPAKHTSGGHRDVQSDGNK